MTQRNNERKSAPKVRSGCLTCKKNRIKCDEQKPRCQKCLSSGRNCDGYESLFRLVEYKTTASCLTKSRENAEVSFIPTLGKWQPPSSAMGRLKSEHSRCLEFFSNKAAPSIFSRMSSDQWISYFTNRSFWWPSVNYALSALSVEYKMFMFQSSNSKEAYGLAITSCENYNQAVRNLNEKLSCDLRQSDMIEEVLATCLILICIEVMRGQDYAALVNLESALHIISESQQRPSRSSQSDSAREIYSNFQKLFSKLDVQAALFVETRIPKSTITSSGDCEDIMSLFHIPAGFDDANTAGRYLDLLSLYAIQFLNSARNKLKYGSADDMNEQENDLGRVLADEMSQTTINVSELLETRDLYLGILQKWATAFQTLLSCCSLTNSSQKLSKTASNQCKEVAILWVTHLVLLIRLSTATSSSEMSYDEFETQFEDIVFYARRFAVESINTVTESCLDSFQMDVGVIEPLYFTAIKCRNHTIRHEALNLLPKCPREGVWDGKAMACIAAYAVAQEEARVHVNNVETPTSTEDFYIPEEVRIHGIAINLDREMKYAKIHLAKMSSFGGTIPAPLDASDDIEASSLNKKARLPEWSAEEHVLQW